MKLENNWKRVAEQHNEIVQFFHELSLFHDLSLFLDLARLKQCLRFTPIKYLKGLIASTLRQSSG